MLNPTTTIKETTWQKDQQALSNIRQAVFIKEQNVPPELEWDENDESAHHWLAYDGQQNAIATLRLLSNGHIGRMAVLNAYRRQGIGAALLNKALEKTQSLQLFETFLYAQTQALDFYRNAGFHGEGDEFLDAGIPHLYMRKQIAKQRLLGVHGGKFSIDDITTTTHELVHQTNRQLRIFSEDLNPAIFDKQQFCEGLSTLARKSRYTDIKILIINSQQITASNHKFIELQRRLPSAIKIRTVANNTVTPSDNYITADNLGIITQSIKEPEIMWGNFNNRPIAEDYNAQFDELWHHTKEDQNLRQLSI